MKEKIIRERSKIHKPKQHKIRNALVAFAGGGSLAVAAQLVMQSFVVFLNVKKDMAVSMTIVLIIFVTALLTALGKYDKIAQFFGAGVFIPISGFANSLASCALEGKSEGLIFGIGSNMFKLAGSVLTCGVVSAFVFGLAGSIIGLLGIAVLITYSVRNGITLLVIAFLVSPVGIPMAAVWLLGKVQAVRYAIQDWVY